jgi:hypothetical protein
VDGKLEKFYSTVCLLEQAFIKNPDVTIGDLLTAKIAELGENICGSPLRPLPRRRAAGKRSVSVVAAFAVASPLQLFTCALVICSYVAGNGA